MDPPQLDPSPCKGCTFLGFGSGSTIPNSDFPLLSHLWFHSPTDRIPQSTLRTKKGDIPTFRCCPYCKGHDTSPSLEEDLKQVRELKGYSCSSPPLLATPVLTHIQLWLCTPRTEASASLPGNRLCWESVAAQQNVVIIHVHINQLMHLKIQQNKWIFFSSPKIHCRSKLN